MPTKLRHYSKVRTTYSFATFVNSSGSTLLELLLSLCIIAVLASITVPWGSRMLQKHRQQADATAILHMLYASRIEAMQKGKTLTFCGTNQNKQCVNSGFDNIIAFEDNNTNQEFDFQDRLLAEAPLKSGVTPFLVPLNSNHIQYHPRGNAKPSAVLLCPTNLMAARARPSKVSLNLGGRPYILSAKHKYWPQVELDCALLLANSN